MNNSPPDRWVFGSLIEAIPNVDPSESTALGLQFIGFTAALFVFAAVYNLWSGVGAGAVAITISTIGSALMLDISDKIRSADPPRVYQRLLFASGFDVLLGIVGMAVLLTYAFTIDPRDGTTLFETLLGSNPPILPTFFGFVLFWDVCYRIGTAWWAALGGLWRAYAYEFDDEAAKTFRQVDLRVLSFGLLQLALVPFVAGHPLLAGAIIGHAIAVAIVTGTTLLLS